MIRAPSHIHKLIPIKRNGLRNRCKSRLLDNDLTCPYCSQQFVQTLYGTFPVSAWPAPLLTKQHSDQKNKIASLVRLLEKTIIELWPVMNGKTATFTNLTPGLKWMDSIFLKSISNAIDYNGGDSRAVIRSVVSKLNDRVNEISNVPTDKLVDQMSISDIYGELFK